MLRSARNYDRVSVSVATALECKDPSLTNQSEAADADINTIVKRFGVSGVLAQRADALLEVDFGEVFDFQSAQNAVIAAQRQFAGLPAKIRERFDHDPAKFIAFFEDEKNIDEAIALGLVIKREKPQDPPKPADPPA